MVGIQSDSSDQIIGKSEAKIDTVTGSTLVKVSARLWEWRVLNPEPQTLSPQAVEAGWSQIEVFHRVDKANTMCRICDSVCALRSSVFPREMYSQNLASMCRIMGLVYAEPSQHVQNHGVAILRRLPSSLMAVHDLLLGPGFFNNLHPITCSLVSCRYLTFHITV